MLAAVAVEFQALLEPLVELMVVHQDLLVVEVQVVEVLQMLVLLVLQIQAVAVVDQALQLVLVVLVL
jgi:hypothetical protein